jgi:hypothetical protein
MGLFDTLKEKAAELIHGAKDQVSEVTGLDLQPDAVGDRIDEIAGSVTEAGQNVADTAEGTVKDVTDPLTGQ